jgi:chloramphenicol 3-O-phosphotransferase
MAQTPDAGQIVILNGNGVPKSGKSSIVAAI